MTGASLTATEHRWWLLAYGVWASGNEAVTLWSSTNSGSSRNRWDASTDHQQPHQVPYYGDKTGLAVDAQGGLWLTGSINGLGMGWLYHSQDSNLRWTAIKLSIPTNWADNEVSYPPVFSNSSHGYLPVTVNGNGNGIAIYSAETSAAWKLAGTVDAPVDVRWDMSVSSPKTLWTAVGHRLWVSHDGGTRWNDAWNTPRRWDFVSVSFSGPRDGVLLALQPLGTAYALWITRDGGFHILISIKGR